MNEREWVGMLAERLRHDFAGRGELRVETGLKLPYGYEIVEYGGEGIDNTVAYETDLAIVEDLDGSRWKPRVVVEAKAAGRISTHDAIIYSQKAATHRAVHPYLRYGIMLGARRHYPLPGRLYRHGTQFDFMISFRAHEPGEQEMTAFTELLEEEIATSRTMEKIIYESRKRGRDHYTILHRRLVLK